MSKNNHNNPNELAEVFADENPMAKVEDNTDIFDNSSVETGWDTVSAEIISWDQRFVNRAIIATITNISEFMEGEFTDKVNKYDLNIKGNAYTTVFGAATDKVLGAHGVGIGSIIRIVYKGKKEIKGGKKVNVFDIRQKREG